ncbi:hypothetical protein LTR97_000211 [Elasticomyces elasticus]|uniref:BTB domain-containing protein n=1 Tax=Elasticomyces elasticus TaxID=574655 RepID=A0AAN8A6E3_9PEZI|nr:hypothetical protein LTR97_000211 [Elasticomyces elasticus]
MAGMTQRQEARDALIDTLGGMFDDPMHSDLKVRCMSREWHVHKVMLCAQSPFFAKACYGRFRPEVVAAMLGYLYTFEYADNHDLIFNVHVHIIADKYDLPRLAIQVQLLRPDDVSTADWQQSGNVPPLLWLRLQVHEGCLVDEAGVSGD